MSGFVVLAVLWAVLIGGYIWWVETTHEKRNRTDAY